MLSVVLIAACLTAALVAAIPAPSPSRLGIQFEKRDELPTLTLPYATYRASEYEANGDVSFHTYSANPQQSRYRSLGFFRSTTSGTSVLQHLPSGIFDSPNQLLLK